MKTIFDDKGNKFMSRIHECKKATANIKRNKTLHGALSRWGDGNMQL